MYVIAIGHKQLTFIVRSRWVRSVGTGAQIISVEQKEQKTITIQIEKN